MYYNSSGRERERTGCSAKDLISATETKAASSFSVSLVRKWLLIECHARDISLVSCSRKGSYLVMNSTGGQMLQRMGSGKQNEKRLKSREMPRCKEKGRGEENMSKGIE